MSARPWKAYLARKKQAPLAPRLKGLGEGWCDENRARPLEPAVGQILLMEAVSTRDPDFLGSLLTQLANFAHRNASAELFDFGLEHRLRSAPLSDAGGERDHAGHRQPMPVFHGSMAHIAELRFPPGRLAYENSCP
jgi:hypothetical protein